MSSFLGTRSSTLALTAVPAAHGQAAWHARHLVTRPTRSRDFQWQRDPTTRTLWELALMTSR